MTRRQCLVNGTFPLRRHRSLAYQIRRIAHWSRQAQQSEHITRDDCLAHFGRLAAWADEAHAMAQRVGWQAIATAPHDRVVLVNDTVRGGWAVARWVACSQWSGWAYQDELLCDAHPLGPCPTHWWDIREIPSGDD